MSEYFPNGFLWGGAIAACQADGAYDKDGRSLAFSDIIEKVDPSKRKEFVQPKITEQKLEELLSMSAQYFPKRFGIDFYLKRKPCNQKIRRSKLVIRIKEIHKESKEI